MTMEIALALLAFSAPITAGILVFRPQRPANGNGNGKYVAQNVFDMFREGLEQRFENFGKQLSSLDEFVRKRL